ncbi:hypothetical protein [Methylomonas sp. AM2-LC]|uniref:hypothetical protein n=1 Tax=Methylomonas sp. AM2-LC TaxID=3153301 RepID=UPI003264AA87
MPRPQPAAKEAWETQGPNSSANYFMVSNGTLQIPTTIDEIKGIGLELENCCHFYEQCDNDNDRQKFEKRIENLEALLDASPFTIDENDDLIEKNHDLIVL